MAVFFMHSGNHRSVPAHKRPNGALGRLRIAVAAVTAALLIAIPLLGLDAPTAIAATPPGCPDVLLIGARGSGETDLRSSGLGPEVLTLYKQLQSDLGKKLTTKSLSVVYTAASVDVLKPDSAHDLALYKQRHLDVFTKSINEGISSALDELSTEARLCKTTRFVLAGYSQGAMVMHQVLGQLTATNNVDLLNRVAATALIADGDRIPKTAANSVWSSKAAPQNSGIRFYFLGGIDIPPVVAADTYSICNAGDFVCDFSEASLLNYKAGFDIHTSYANTKLVKGVGTRIANRLLPPAASLDHIVISPSSASVQAGQTQTYTAAGFGSLNNLLGDVTVSTAFSIFPDGSCTGAVCTATIPGPHTVVGVDGNLRATAVLNIQAIPTGPSHLFWTTYSTGTIRESNLDGTAVTSLVTGQLTPYGIAVDSSHIYWTTHDTGTVSKANLDGTGVTTLVTGQNRPYGIAVDSSHIYWTDNYGTISKANLDGTGVTTLVTGQSNPTGIAVDSGHFYWADTGLGTISGANLDGTGVTTLVAGQNTPYGVAVDSSHVYWTNIVDNTIKGANLDGTGVTTVVTGQDPAFLAVGP